MRKQLSFITNQNGFFLPSALFLMAIVLIVVSANINTYKSDSQITDNQLEQLKIESLLQMGRSKFKQELTDPKFNNNPITYTFSDGTVQISYIRPSDTIYELILTINTDEKSYITTNVLTLE